MFAPDDTIVAVATASGRAGIGVVRISGGLAVDIARALLAIRAELQPRVATFTRLRTDGDIPVRTWGRSGGDVVRRSAFVYRPARRRDQRSR